MNKENAVQTCNEIYSVFKKEGHFDTYYDVDEPRRHYPK